MGGLELTFEDVNSKPLKPKASIYKDGKLGFDSDGAEFLDLEEGQEFAVASLPEEVEKALVLVPAKREHPSDSVKEVRRAGDYYNLPLRDFFDRKEVPYKKLKIKYNIEKVEEDGETAFILRADGEHAKR